MAENSKIQWTTHTFNPWRGCTKVSAGCAHCYADTQSKRNSKTLGVWGPNGTRVVASEAMWKEPLKWEREAMKERRFHNAHVAAEMISSGGYQTGQYGYDAPTQSRVVSVSHPERPRVFCASMADVFEDWTGFLSHSNGSVMYICNECGSWQTIENMCCGPNAHFPLTIKDVRNRLFSLIDQTPNLDWLLLTKRPENIAKMMPKPVCPLCKGKGGWETGPHSGSCRCEHASVIRPNVWLGTSVEDQKAADQRIPHLLRVPAKVRFLSVEPLLGPVDLSQFLHTHSHSCYSLDKSERVAQCPFARGIGSIDWVIIGGESGPNARPCRVEWIRDIVNQCKAAGVPVFVKQLGANVITRNDMIEDAFNDGKSGWPDPQVEHNIHGFREDHQGADCRIRLNDTKGGDMSEWPEDLRVREFPEVSR